MAALDLHGFVATEFKQAMDWQSSNNYLDLQVVDTGNTAHPNTAQSITSSNSGPTTVGSDFDVVCTFSSSQLTASDGDWNTIDRARLHFRNEASTTDTIDFLIKATGTTTPAVTQLINQFWKITINKLTIRFTGSA